LYQLAFFLHPRSRSLALSKLNIATFLEKARELCQRYKINSNAQQKVVTSMFEYAESMDEFGKEYRKALVFGNVFTFLFQ
jgi:hypothetical protein